VRDDARQSLHDVIDAFADDIEDPPTLGAVLGLTVDEVTGSSRASRRFFIGHRRGSRETTSVSSVRANHPTARCVT
jgi:hypothetical protein